MNKNLTSAFTVKLYRLVQALLCSAPPINIFDHGCFLTPVSMNTTVLVKQQLLAVIGQIVRARQESGLLVDD